MNSEENSVKSQINKDKLPKHIAVIMDGNGRWAQKQHKERVYGHQNGVTAVRNVTEACAEIGIKFLTLYTFSKENWNRPKEEVDALMELLVSAIKNEEKTLMENNIRLETIGDVSELTDKTRIALENLIEKTSENTRMTLVLALNYSARWEIINAVKDISSKVKQGSLSVDDITDETFASSLTTRNMPDPDLLIRTSGEQRISNFLLWQIAYSELYFTDVLWPDFTKEDLYQAVVAFQNRNRRYGKTQQQIEKE